MLLEVQELVASNGNVRLAAERLGVSPIELTKTLLENREELAAAVQTSVLLQLLDVSSNYRVALIAALDDMGARDIVRSYAAILEQINTVMYGPEGGGNNGLNFLQLVKGDADTPVRLQLDSAAGTPNGVR